MAIKQISIDAQRQPPGPQAAALEPYAVPVPEAQRLLGDKSHSALYELLGRGELAAIKDGAKTLIVLASIWRYQASLPPAKIGPRTPRRVGRRQIANGARDDPRARPSTITVTPLPSATANEGRRYEQYLPETSRQSRPLPETSL